MKIKFIFALIGSFLLCSAAFAQSTGQATSTATSPLAAYCETLKTIKFQIWDAQVTLSEAYESSENEEQRKLLLNLIDNLGELFKAYDSHATQIGCYGPQG